MSTFEARYRAVKEQQSRESGNTFADVTSRFACTVWRQFAHAEMIRRFPTLTPENFREATEFMESTYRAAIKSAGVPNA